MKPFIFTALLLVPSFLPLPMQAAFPAGANNFASAPVIPTDGETTSSVTDLFGFSMEAGEPSHNPNNPGNFPSGTGGRSAWWKWTPTVNGFCTVDTTATLAFLFGSNPVTDTVLSVYTGTAVNALTRVVANNQHGHYTVNADSNLAKATFYAVAGTTYFIAVDGGSSGEITTTRRNVILRLRQLPAQALTRRSLWSISRADVSKQGLITLTTTAAGGYTAALQAGSVTHRFTGVFDTDGTSRRALPRTAPAGAPPLTPIVVTLDGCGQGGVFVEIDGAYASSNLPVQAVFSKTEPASVAGTYNIASRDEFINTASARGYLRLTVSATGAVSATGVAMDGTMVTAGSALMKRDSSNEFTFPAYLSLHKGKGSFTVDGFISNGATPAEDLAEVSTDYIRPAAPGAAFLPAGVMFDEYLVGHVYTKPAPNSRALGFLNPGGFGQFAVYEAAGEMASRVLENVTFSTANKFVFASTTRKPVLTLNTATGLVTGSITTTDTILGATKSRVRTVRGILFLDDNGEPHIYGHATGVTTPLMIAVLPSNIAE